MYYHSLHNHFLVGYYTHEVHPIQHGTTFYCTKYNFLLPDRNLHWLYIARNKYIPVFYSITYSNTVNDNIWNMSQYEELEDPTGKYGGYKENLVPDTATEKVPKCCGCRRKVCILTFIVINILLCAAIIVYLRMIGGKLVLFL